MFCHNVSDKPTIYLYVNILKYSMKCAAKNHAALAIPS
jgi:hypothetical protein